MQDPGGKSLEETDGLEQRHALLRGDLYLKLEQANTTVLLPKGEETDKVNILQNCRSV